MLEHMNLKNVFSAAQGRHERDGMARALRLCGPTLKGDHHRALPDAKNIAPAALGGRGESQSPEDA